MSQDIVCRKCRREGQKLFLKGEKCFSPKCPFTRRSYAPGEHGARANIRLSEYGRQLREKQKIRFIYGISERQLRNYYKKASKAKGSTAEIFIILIETRLENILHRSGLAKSRRQARQMIRSGHVEVDGQKIDIPSYQVKSGQQISIAKKFQKMPYFSDVLKSTSAQKIPSWLSLDKKNFKIIIDHLPKREEVDIPVEESLILEYYSR